MPVPNTPGLRVLTTGTEHTIDPFDAEQAIKSQLPLLDNPLQTDYLGYRACGFGPRESASLTGISFNRVREWRRHSEAFEYYELNMPLLQKHLGELITKFQFHRNMALSMKIDGDILRKAAFGEGKLNGMTPIEQKVLSEALRRYDAQGYLTISKALEPDRHQDGGGTGDINIQVNVDGVSVESEMAKVAATRELLSRFTVNRQIIEGFAVVKDEDDFSDLDD